MTTERRSHRRLQVRKARLKSPTLTGRVINLSASGLAIETHQHLRLGAQYYFLLDREKKPMRFEGRVLWCRLKTTIVEAGGDVTPVYIAGIQRLDGG